MITSIDTETKEELEVWIDHVSIPRQGELVDLDGEIVKVKTVVHTPKRIMITVER